jgi:mRNA interferase RelE/StbE
MVRVRFTPEAARIVAKLPPEIKQLIRSAIDDLREDPRKGAELAGQFAGYRSLKSRRYRLIYRLNEDEATLDVYLVGRRRDVYESLRALLEDSLRRRR